jgi:hypothetical protein
LSWEAEFWVWLWSSVERCFYVLWLFWIASADGFLGVRKAASFMVKSLNDWLVTYCWVGASYFASVLNNDFSKPWLTWAFCCKLFFRSRLMSSRMLSRSGFSCFEAVWLDLRLLSVCPAISLASIPRFYSRMWLMIF